MLCDAILEGIGDGGTDGEPSAAFTPDPNLIIPDDGRGGHVRFILDSYTGGSVTIGVYALTERRGEMGESRIAPVEPRRYSFCFTAVVSTASGIPNNLGGSAFGALPPGSYWIRRTANTAPGDARLLAFRVPQ